jgi:hypothetical protein
MAILYPQFSILDESFSYSFTFVNTRSGFF